MLQNNFITCFFELVKMKTIVFDGLTLFLNRRAGTHHIKLRLNKNGDPVVTFPFFCSEKRAIEFVKKHREWIHIQQKNIPSPQKFHKGVTFELFGHPVTIKCSDKHCVTHIEDNVLIVSGKTDFVHRRVRDFIKKNALLYFNQKAHDFADRIGCKINTVRLKDTSSRWGSCSSTGNLNFSWRLALAPVYVSDYIIAHEVAHLKQLNHGPDFWKTVALFETDQASAEIWLRKNGHTLHTWIG